MKFESQQLLTNLKDEKIRAHLEHLCEEDMKTEYYHGGPFDIVRGHVKTSFIRPLDSDENWGVLTRQVEGNLLFYLYNWLVKMRVDRKWIRVSPFNFDNFEL